MAKNLKEEGKKRISELVARFKKSESKYMEGREFETQIKLINELFEALGWDVRGLKDFDEVRNEVKIKEGRADYSFKINGVTKFVLEAKKPSVNLDDQRTWFQAVTYGYNKGLAFAGLTNFKRMIVFNVESDEKDLEKVKVLDLTCDEFVTEFEKLWWLSKEGIAQGVLEKEAEQRGAKRKRLPVDEQLFKDLLYWRNKLYKNIKKNNQGLPEQEIDENIQVLLNRLIFIRFCEDKGYSEKVLLENLHLWEQDKKTSLWNSLRGIFDKFDDDYNSGLFEKRTCDMFNIDDKELKEIIYDLYNSQEHSIAYKFDALSADILGSVYEQFLGSVAYRKGQGVYYTPKYIVEYIVRNTLGEMLKEKKLNVDKLRTLDPACGSGGFLVGALDYLMEYYKKKSDITQQKLAFDTDGVTYSKKADILRNNVFGVDLDKKAVDIAQLNLFLKIAENRKTLPNIKDNIQNGNSIIDDPTVAGDKAFKWKERFKTIMNEDGFDVIIGNPPYVKQQELADIKPYLQKNYEVYNGMADLFVYFFEREMELLKGGGYFGMIVSNKWLRAGYGTNLRKFISRFWIEKFIDFGDLKVFPNATIYPCIIILRKLNKPNPKIQVCKIKTLDFDSLEEYIKKNQFPLNQNELSEKEWNIQNVGANQLINKIASSGIGLEKYANSRIYRGILTGLNEAFVIDEKKRNELIAEDKKSAEIINPFLTGTEIKHYLIKSKRNYIILTKIGVEINKYPAIKKHLSNFQADLEKRWDKGKYWYELRNCAYYDLFDKQKIVWGNLATKASFAFDDTGFYVNAPACILPTSSKYILGILNSKLMSYFLKSICAERQGGFIEQKPVYVSKIPIKDAPEPQQQIIIKLVEKMLSLNKHLTEIGDKKTDEHTRIEEEIKKIDAEIDELVYKLYGITDSEKRIIEESLK